MRSLPLVGLVLLMVFVCTPVYADDGSSSGTNAGEQMIINAISKVIINVANGVLTGFGGVELGELNNSENYSGEQVAIFSVVAHSIDPTKDPEIQKEVKNTKELYIWGMKFFGMLMTAFMIYQQVRPYNAAQVVGVVRGRPGYITIEEMAEYYIISCFWLLCGPGILYASLWLNNFLVQSLTLSVLDEVSFSSDNAAFYAIMTVLWLLMAAFFAVRIVLILLATKVWYLFGLALAVHKSRWIGLLTAPYTLVFVFSQFFIVWTVVAVINYSHSSSLNWVGSGFLYLGMFIVVIVEGLVFSIWPWILKKLSPTSYTFVVNVAKAI